MNLMTRTRVVISRALDVFIRRRRDDRLSAEIETHLDLLTEQYLARGMTPAEARSAARRAFGDVARLNEVYQDQRGLPLVDTLWRDVRFAVRLLRRDRGFALTAICVLGVGIGVNNMLFTILYAHTLRGMPIPSAERVVYISTIGARTPEAGLSYPEYVDVREAAQTFAALAAFTSAPAAVAGDGRAADRFEATFLSAATFDVIPVQPVVGRAFAREDDNAGAAAVVMLGSAAWHSRYGADPTILGRSILVNGAPATVIGVLPDRSGLPTTAELWLPLAQAPGVFAQKRDARTLRLIGRVREGLSVTEARVEIDGIFDRLSRDHPDTNHAVRARTIPINERFFGRVTDPAWLAFITAGCLVVIISCANVANLLLGRSVTRTREIAIRLSLGASRGRILRQLLIEGAVLAVAGGAAGLALSLAGVRLFRRAIPQHALPYWVNYAADARVIAALISVACLTVFLFALLPALQTSHTDVNRVLKDGGRMGLGRGRTSRWTTAFLAAEFALAVVLLAQVVVSFRVSRPALRSDEVLDSNSVVTAAITLPAATYQTPEQRINFYRQLDERIRALPGISNVSLATALPLAGAVDARLEVPGSARGADQQPPTVRSVAVGPGYFETLGLALLRGRDFDRTDGDASASVIVNEQFVSRFFPGREVVGERIAVTPLNTSSSAITRTIIGIAPDIRQRPFPDPEPLVYLSYEVAPPPNMSLLVRSNEAASALVPSIRAAAQALDPNLPLYRIHTLADVRRNAQWNGRLSHWLVLSITFIAVALSTIGLYAVTAHAVSQRSQEIGVRMALGARPAQVVGMVVRRAFIQLAFGFLAGIIATMVWDSMFSSGRVGTTATDPQSLVAIIAILTFAAVIACIVPARRAIRLDPLVAIRGD